MTNGEKMLITQQRRQGLGYTEIARKLGMSVNTVKSYCQRNGIKPAGKAVVQSDNTCRQCGNTLQQIPGKKKKQLQRTTHTYSFDDIKWTKEYLDYK